MSPPRAAGDEVRGDPALHQRLDRRLHGAQDRPVLQFGQRVDVPRQRRAGGDHDRGVAGEPVAQDVDRRCGDVIHQVHGDVFAGDARVGDQGDERHARVGDELGDGLGDRAVPPLGDPSGRFVMHELSAQHHQCAVILQSVVQARLVVVGENQEPSCCNQVGKIHTRQGRGDEAERRLGAEDEAVAAEPLHQGLDVVTETHPRNHEAELVFHRHGGREPLCLGHRIVSTMEIDELPIGRGQPGRRRSAPGRLERNPLLVVDGIDAQRQLGIVPPQGAHVVQEQLVSRNWSHRVTHVCVCCRLGFDGLRLGRGVGQRAGQSERPPQPLLILRSRYLCCTESAQMLRHELDVE